METVGDVLVWVVGLGRLLTGLVFLARPDRPARSWVGDVTSATTYLVRAVGGRDLIIGVGVLWAMLAGELVVPWLLASVGGDVVDGASSVMLNPDRRNTALAFAGGFGLLGLLTIAVLLLA